MGEFVNIWGFREVVGGRNCFHKFLGLGTRQPPSPSLWPHGQNGPYSNFPSLPQNHVHPVTWVRQLTRGQLTNLFSASAPSCFCLLAMQQEMEQVALSHPPRMQVQVLFGRRAIVCQ